MLKKKKHVLTLTCLVVGMLVLTSAVYANYDDARGYSNYKDALKSLVFEETNFTAEIQATVSMDGKDIQTMEEMLKNAGKNSSAHHRSTFMAEPGDGTPHTWESLDYRNEKTSVHYQPKENTYYESEAHYKSTSDVLIPLEDKTSKKAVRFVELLADTMVGDLKNNVVLDSIDENGVRNYSIHVTGNQIPEVVNAGLSLMFGAAADSGSGDGNDETDIFSMYAEEAHIGDAVCKVSIDENGKLVANYLEASMVGTDVSGKKHTAMMKVDAKIFDYGKTVADVFDPAGKNKSH